MRIAISTIAKNEEHNVKGFIESCEGADLISVLDTGSTDKTVSLLKKAKAYAGSTVITPFRFDTARQQALELLPDDIDVVVSIDMDERLQLGWREALERAWNPEEMDSLSYFYIGEWLDEEKTKPAVTTWRTKIFKRHGFAWYRPVHEVPLLMGEIHPRAGFAQDLIVHHLQNGTRDYEPALTLLINDRPNDPEAYLQRAGAWSEKKEWKKAIDDTQTYMDLSAVNTCPNVGCDACQLRSSKRASALISSASCHYHLGYAPAVWIKILLKAVAESPKSREAWANLSEAYFASEDYSGALHAALVADSIKNSGMHARDEMVWGDFPRKMAEKSYNELLKNNPLVWLRNM